MSYGDSFFHAVISGSTSGSEIPNLLFGSYQGLSDLGQNEVVNIQLCTTTAEARVWDTTTTNNTGFRLNQAASIIDLPPMRVGAASLMKIMRETATSPTVLWTVWRRVSGAMQ